MVLRENVSTPTKYQFTGQYSFAGEFGLLDYKARYYDPALGRFAAADTVIPQGQGVQAWDRYAYANNSPIGFNDPSGHWPDLPSWLNPFSYDTVSLTVKGLVKAVVGIDVDINLSVDTRSFKEGYAKGGLFEGFSNFAQNGMVAITLNIPVSAGISGEGALGIGVTGTDGGIFEQTGVNVIGKDGVTVNYSANPIGIFTEGGTGGPGLVPFGATTIDPYSKNGFASSQTWGLGIGVGYIDLSVDIVGATDWVFYADSNKTEVQLPYIHP